MPKHELGHGEVKNKLRLLMTELERQFEGYVRADLTIRCENRKKADSLRSMFYQRRRNLQRKDPKEPFNRFLSEIVVSVRELEDGRAIVRFQSVDPSSLDIVDSIAIQKLRGGPVTKEELLGIEPEDEEPKPAKPTTPSSEPKQRILKPKDPAHFEDWKPISLPSSGGD